MFGTPLDWVIVVGVLATLIILIWFMVQIGNASKKLVKTQEVVDVTSNKLTNTANNVDNIVGEASPIVGYVRNGICNSPFAKTIFGEPPAGFCPSAPAPAIA